MPRVLASMLDPSESGETDNAAVQDSTCPTAVSISTLIALVPLLDKPFKTVRHLLWS
jgi:hypothetical protein